MIYEKNLSQTEHVYLCIQEEIISGVLAPGIKIKINDLCKRYDASLGAVREALSRLTAEGLVQAEAQKGFKVTPISLEDLESLAIARIEIESICLEYSIKSGNLEWESQILAAFHRLKMTPERMPDNSKVISADWEKHHRHFHFILVSACANTWLLKVRDYLFVQSERYRRLSTQFDAQNRNIGHEHELLMNAILQKDVMLAKTIIRDHILTTKNIIADKLV